MKTAWLLAIGDTHFGGYRSLMPKGFRYKVENREGRYDRKLYRLTAGQRYLLYCFNEMQRRVRKYTDRYVLAHMGDIIHGYHDQMFRILCLPDTDDQSDAAELLLTPLVAESVGAYFCCGTKFHRGTKSNPEWRVVDLIRRNLREMKLDIPCKYADAHNIRILDKTFNFVHGHSQVQDWPMTPLGREAADNILFAELKQTPKADVILRAHIHPSRFSPIYEFNKWAVFTPAWHLPTEYTSVGRARYFRSIPLIGALLFRVTEEPMPAGVSIIPITFPQPRAEMRVERVKW